MTKTDFSLSDHFTPIKWMKEHDIRKTYDYQRKFIRFIEGEESMTEKRAQAADVAKHKLKKASIKARDVRPEPSYYDGVGYWIPARIFIGNDELVSDKELEEVAYSTAENMEVSVLLHIVSEHLMEQYKDDHELYEEDKKRLRRKQ